MPKYVNYVSGEGDVKTARWNDLNEFQMELEPGEFTLIWASGVVRQKALKAAEDVFPNYNHPEPLNIGGMKRIVEIGSALPILEGPILVTCPHPSNSEETVKAITKGEKTGYTWRLREEAGLQAMVSIGWLCDIAKARQPPISKNTSEIAYAADLLPTNMLVKEDEAPTGYNKKQADLMQEAKKEMLRVLGNIPELKAAWIDIPIIPFGEKLFRTASKIFTSLPDLEEEEKKKFEQIRAQAKANANPQGDPGE
jgi:hypothetical protein